MQYCRYLIPKLYLFTIDDDCGIATIIMNSPELCARHPSNRLMPFSTLDRVSLEPSSSTVENL